MVRRINWTFSFYGFTFNLIMSLLLAIGLTIWVIYDHRIECTVKDIASIFIACALVFQLGYWVSNMLTAEQDANVKRLMFTYQCTNDWHVTDIQKHSDNLRIKLKHVKPEDVPRLLRTDDDLNFSAKRVLGYLETLSIHMKSGLIDETVTKELFEFVFLKVYNQMQAYIETVRGGEGHQSNSLYIHFKSVVEAWKDEKNIPRL